MPGESPPPVADRDCVAFLQWALPRVGMRWRGFRRVRRQVCKRLKGRLAELGLPDLAAYRAYLVTHPGEWRELEWRCPITISRFYRDQGVFGALGEAVLPALARAATTAGRPAVRAWSVGCASGEEPYSLVLAWCLGGGHGDSGRSLAVLGTDIDPVLLARARRGCYPEAALRELPAAWRRQAFRQAGEEHCLRAEYQAPVTFRQQDVRRAAPEGPFDLILCRNLVLTYFQPEGQRRLLATLGGVLREGGALVIGAQEALPSGDGGWTAWPGARAVFRKGPRAPAPT